MPVPVGEAREDPVLDRVAAVGPQLVPEEVDHESDDEDHVGDEEGRVGQREGVHQTPRTSWP